MQRRKTKVYKTTIRFSQEAREVIFAELDIARRDPRKANTVSVSTVVNEAVLRALAGKRSAARRPQRSTARRPQRQHAEASK